VIQCHLAKPITVNGEPVPFDSMGQIGVQVILAPVAESWGTGVFFEVQ